MPFSIDDTKRAEALWSAQASDRNDMTIRQQYYDGHHKITTTTEVYADNTEKSQVVTNWILYITDQYVGALTSTPFQVTRSEDDQTGDIEPGASTQTGPAPTENPETNPANIYGALENAQHLQAKDQELLEDAFLLRQGIELHTFDDDSDIGDRIDVYDPREWALIWNEQDELLGAIHRIELPADSFYGEESLDSTTEIMTLYDRTRIARYRRSTEKNNPWVAVEGYPKEHPYKRVPIVPWAMNQDHKSMVSDALIGQNDEYNAIDSMSGDNIRVDTDALLVLSGYSAQTLSSDKVIELIQRKRILPLPDAESVAKYLTKAPNFEFIEARLQRTRAHIHTMAAVPDVQKVTGATGSTSGIALKLAYTPMQRRAAKMIPHIRKALRERITLYNAIRKLKGQPPIEKYNIVVQFTIPVNRIEEWQNIGALNGLVSHQTMLELLSDIDDPQRELQALAKEQPPLPEQTPEETIRQSEAVAAQLRPQMETNLAVVVDRVAAAAIQSLRPQMIGLVKDALAAKGTQEGSTADVI